MNPFFLLAATLTFLNASRWNLSPQYITLRSHEVHFLMYLAGKYEKNIQILEKKENRKFRLYRLLCSQTQLDETFIKDNRFMPIGRGVYPLEKRNKYLTGPHDIFTIEYSLQVNVHKYSFTQEIDSRKVVHAALLDEKFHDQDKLFLLCDPKYTGNNFASSFRFAAFEQAKLRPVTILNFSGDDKFGLDFWLNNWPAEYFVCLDTIGEPQIKVFHKSDPLDVRTLIVKNIKVSITKLAIDESHEDSMCYFIDVVDSIELAVKTIKESKGSVFLTSRYHSGNENANIAEMVLVIYKFLEIQKDRKENDPKEILRITGLISPLARMAASHIRWDMDSIAKTLSDIIFEYRLRKHEFGDKVVLFSCLFFLHRYLGVEMYPPPGYFEQLKKTLMIR